MRLQTLASALLAGLLGVSSPALAQWSYSEVPREAGQPRTHLAVTSEQYHGMGLRCDGGTLSVQYLTNDPMNDEQMARANAGPIALALTVDERTTRLAGQLQRVPQGVVFVALAERDLLQRIRDNREPIEIAIALGPRLTHQRTFAAQGAEEALDQLAAHCTADEARARTAGTSSSKPAVSGEGEARAAVGTELRKTGEPS